MCVKIEKRLLFLGITYAKIKKVVQLVMFPDCITFFHETGLGLLHSLLGAGWGTLKLGGTL
jgi:Zn-dependent oligopeptidase